MENKEKKETPLEYFHRRTRNNIINLGYQLEAYEYARIMYEKEIEESKKEGWRKGYEDAIKFYKQFENK